MPTPGSEVVRLYRFYNTVNNEYGVPFGMCDWHKSTYQMPSMCVMELLASVSGLACQQCEYRKTDERQGSHPVS